MVLRQGMAFVGIGMIVGLAGALALTRAIRGLLYNVSSSDPITYLSIAALLGAVALITCFFPARRATRIDPIAALKDD